MTNNLNTLVRLQEVDRKLRELEGLKGDLPERLRQMRELLEELEHTFAAKKEEHTQTVLDRRHWENEVTRLEELGKKTQDKLYSVTTNREYDAITLEIEETQNLLSEAETRVIELLEREQQLEAEVEALEGQLGELRQDVSAKEVDLQQRIKKTEDQVRELAARRASLQELVPQQILNQYERVRRGKGGTTVVGISRGACGGCFTKIPPQRVWEVRQMNQLIFCEACGRILVWTNGAE